MGVVEEAGILAFVVMRTNPPPDEAVTHLARIREAADRADRLGWPNGITHAGVALGGALRESEPGEALILLERAADLAVAVDAELTANQASNYLADHYISLGRPHDGLALISPAIQRHIRSGAWGWAWLAVISGLRALIDSGRPELAVVVLGALTQEPDGDVIAADNAFPALEAQLRAQLGSTEVDRLLADGKHLTVADVAPLVLEAIDELLA